MLPAKERHSNDWTGPIILAADNAYAMPLATTLRSIVESNRANWPIDFRIFDTDMSPARKEKVAGSLPAGSAVIRWCAVDLAAFSRCLTHAHISTTTYARLLIPSAVDPHESRAVFIDSDVLVLEDLTPLWQADLEGAPVGAVLDGMEPGRLLGDARFSGVPPVREYFNAGVLVVDVERWRREQVSEKALEYLVRCPRSPYSDQDALNVACDGLWTRLGGRWNFQNHYRAPIGRMTQDARPAIVHFVTFAKPWIAAMRSVNASFYDDFRSRTLYARTAGERLRDSMVRLSAGVTNVARRSTDQWRGLLTRAVAR
jgi:lipopolysaccharide biosynthesis glycosyltransferase